MKKLIIFFLFIISNFFLIGQPSIQWQKSLGGTNSEEAISIQQTTDGGYIVAGSSNSNDSDVTGNYGGADCWIVKLDNAGEIQWQKSLGGTNSDGAGSIQQTTDGGYIIAGGSNSNDIDVTGNHGNSDCWILKLDYGGTLQWQKSLGGTTVDATNSIQQTIDGGYIVAGYTFSNDGDVTGNHGNSDCWIVKLDNVGTLQWQKSLGGTGSEAAYSIQQTTDGGYIVAGGTNSNDSDVTGNHGLYDCWIVKLDNAGTLQWQKSFGGTSYDEAYSIQQTTDGGYIFAGYTLSNDNDVTGNHGLYDCWIVKLDSAGTLQWQKSLGGTNGDQAHSIQQTTDGGYIVAGWSRSNDIDLTGNFGDKDSWMVKLDNTGVLQWQKSFGGTNTDVAYSIQQTTDGGYIVAGWSNSNDSDVTGNHGLYDCWIVKLSPTVNVSDIQNSISDFQITPNPFSSVTTLSIHLSNQKNSNIEIRDIEGRIIKYFNSKNLNIGSNEIVWDATNNSGTKVDNGLYFITISSDNFSETKKAVVLRD